MTKAVFLSVTLWLFLSVFSQAAYSASSKPVQHTHNGRSHIHVLPQSGLNHNHQSSSTNQNKPAKASNPMLHQRGTQIVDGSGRPVKLRGTLIEGWLIWNGTLWGTGLNSETHIYTKISELVGEKNAQRFRRQVYDNFFTEADVKLMAEMGFNTLRVPFNHTIIEDDARPFVYKQSGWDYLDRVIQWCERYNIYVVLDLHSAPGGQSRMFVSDPDKELLWNSTQKQQRTIALWKAIATRYRNKKIIAGYDLINEPDPHDKRQLVTMYQRITQAIREVDPYHLVILEGTGAAMDFSMFNRLSAQPVENMAYSFHSYNLFSNHLPKTQMVEMKKLSDKHQTPIWNSEFGAHTSQWIKATTDSFEAPNNGVSGWIYWPWKRISERDKKRWGLLMEIPSTPNWDKTRIWIGALFGLAPKPTRQEALQGMCEFLKQSATHNLSVNTEMAKALRVNDRPNNKQADSLASINAMCASK